MYSLIKNIHVVMVGLFMLLQFVRLIVMGARNETNIEKFLLRMRIPNAIIFPVILLTGIYLIVFSRFGFQPYLMIKLLMVVIAMTLGVIGSKRKNLSLLGLSMTLWGIVLAIAFFRPNFLSSTPDFVDNPVREKIEILADNPTDSTQFSSEKKEFLEGKFYFYEHGCATCHGNNGKSSFLGAKNLDKSTMTGDQIRNIVAQGRGEMPAIPNISEDHLNKLVSFLQSLRSNQQNGNPVDLSQ